MWLDCCNYAVPSPFTEAGISFSDLLELAGDYSFQEAELLLYSFFGITFEFSFFCSNVTKIKHLIYYVGMFQSKVKGWL